MLIFRDRVLPGVHHNSFGTPKIATETIIYFGGDQPSASNISKRPAAQRVESCCAPVPYVYFTRFITRAPLCTYHPLVTKWALLSSVYFYRQLSSLDPFRTENKTTVIPSSLSPNMYVGPVIKGISPQDAYSYIGDRGWFDPLTDPPPPTHTKTSI